MKFTFKHFLLIIMTLTPVSVVASGLFEFKLGSNIKDILNNNKSENIKLKKTEYTYGDGSRKIINYKSPLIRMKDGKKYEYTLLVNPITDKIWRINYTIYFNEPNILNVFGWVNSKFGKPFSGPYQTFSLNPSTFKVSMGNWYFMTWGCSLKPVYLKGRNSVSFKQSTNNLCTKATISKSFSNTHEVSISIESVPVMEEK